MWMCSRNSWKGHCGQNKVTQSMVGKRSGRRAGQNVMETHIQGRAHIHSDTWRGGMQVAMAAVRQERWQYVGIAGSQFNSYASILPPLQFQVTGGNTMSLRCFTFPKSPLPPEGGKTHSLIKNASLFLNLITVFLEHPIWKL